MARQSLVRRLTLEALEDRLALSQVSPLTAPPSGSALLSTPFVDAGPDQTVNEGTQPNSIPFTGRFVDTNPARYGDTSIFYVYDGAGRLVEDGGVFVNRATGNLSYSVVQVKPGDYTVRLEVRNDVGTGYDTAVLHVLTNPGQGLPSTPAVDAGPDQTVFEGNQPNSFAFTATFVDPHPAGYYSVIFYVYDSAGKLVEDGGASWVYKYNGQANYTVTQVSPGDYTIRVEVNNGANTGYGTTHLHVLANPLPPSTPVVNAGPDKTVYEGTQPNLIPFTANFCDARPGTYYSAIFYVYDGAGRFVEDGGAFVNKNTGQVSYSVVQVKAGNYTIRVDVSNGTNTGSGVTHLHVLANPVITTPVVKAPMQLNLFSPRVFDTYTINASFSDTGKGPWTATYFVYTSGGLLYRHGSATINSQTKTVSATVSNLFWGDYTLFVQVSNGQRVGTGVTRLHVRPSAPFNFNASLNPQLVDYVLGSYYASRRRF